MKKTQKPKPKAKKTKAMIQNLREIYNKTLEGDLEYIKRMGDNFFEIKFTDVNNFFIKYLFICNSLNGMPCIWLFGTIKLSLLIIFFHKAKAKNL